MSKASFKFNGNFLISGITQITYFVFGLARIRCCMSYLFVFEFVLRNQLSLGSFGSLQGYPYTRDSEFSSLVLRSNLLE